TVATYNRGRGALTKYWGKDSYGVAPGCLMGKERRDAISIREREFYKKLQTVNTPLEKINLVIETINQKSCLANWISHTQYLEYHKIFAENAQLVLKDSPEYAQELFDGFLSIYYGRSDHDNGRVAGPFYRDLTKYAPDVFLANISKILQNKDIDIFGRCKEIYEGGGKYASQALDCMLSHASTIKYIDELDERGNLIGGRPKSGVYIERLLYGMTEREIPIQDKIKIAEWAVSKEHIDDISQRAFMSLGDRPRDEKNLVSFCEKISEDQKHLSSKFCEGVFYIAKKLGCNVYLSDNAKLTSIFDRIIDNDLSYYSQNIDVFAKANCLGYFSQKVALQDHSLIPNVSEIDRENFDAFAKIYEEYASRSNDREELLGQKNVALGDDKKETEIMTTIKDKILENGKSYYNDNISKPVQAWLVKNAKKYPNLVNDILKEKELPYVEMCIRNVENPEKENIASLLNRLETKEAKSFEDFQDAQEFVTRRDMCMRGCLSFVKEREQELRAQYPDYTGDFVILNSKKFSYEIAEAGIGDFKTAKRVAQLFCALNERPEAYNSSYNTYYPKDLLPIAKSEVMQEWMYPVMMEAIGKGSLTMSEGRMPSERTLFDCCKAWKICPEMPQRLAKEVGNYSLRGRMLAGAVFEHMCEKGNTTPQEWRENKELHQKFYEELDRAQKMPKDKAFKQYIPNTPVNRKRLVAMGMEEKGIENTPDNFRELYQTMREKGVFEKTLAKPEDARTVFSSRLMVKLARQKNQGK
ncbi:MAG: hypothetical protein IKL33_02010, partial [Alphaproteobacteria bacterium]|nr:hypothetical protein [Alphaproteobacteria bacterium]